MLTVFVGVLGFVMLFSLIVESIIMSSLLVRNFVLKNVIKTLEDSSSKQKSILEYRKQEIVRLSKINNRLELKIKSRNGGLNEKEEEELIEDELEEREKIIV